MKRVILRIYAMASKEVVHIARDPQMLVFALGMPVVLIFLFGYAVSFDIERIPMVVVDQDHTSQSRALVEKFTASDTFRVVAERRDPKQVETLFRSNMAKAAIIIPAGYGRHLRRGENAHAQLLLDGADNTTASIALGYANAVSLAASRAELERVVGDIQMPMEARTRVFFNPRLKSAVFLVPGLMVVILVMVAVMLTALTIAREYERGSMEQLFATPVGRVEVILGKLAPYFLIGLVQVLLVLALGVTFFDVPVRGSLPLLFGLSSVFLLAMLMQGLVVSVVTRNQMVASQVAMISTFLPALLLSGFIFPVQNMPLPLRVLANVMPAQYYVRALRAVLLRGNGLEVIWIDILAIAGFFFLMLLISVKKFKRTVGKTMWTSLLAILAKEYRQTFRDKRMVALLMVAPVIQLLVLGFAVNLQVEHVPTVIADEDRTPASRRFADQLTAGDAFDRKTTVTSSKAAEDLVARGEVPIAVIIPRGYSKRLSQGKPVALQALVDGGDSNRAIMAQNAFATFVMTQAADRAQAQARTVAAARGMEMRIPQVRVQPRILYNPTQNSQIYFVPGVAATLLLIVTLITTAMGLAREKEMGTLEQVMVTPIRPEILILGKTLPYGLIGLVDLGLVIALGAWIFDVPIRGSLPLIFFAGSLYLLTTLGVGLLVSVLARSQQQAMMGGMFYVMPAILLSGFMTPVENMPTWLQPLSNFTPVRHFVEIMRGVLLKDAGFWELSPQLAALAGLGAVVYWSAAYMLRRSLR